MRLFIFRTNIESKNMIMPISNAFEKCIGILDWSIDFEDIDHVLRIEAANNLDERDIIKLVSNEGYQIGELPD